MYVAKVKACEAWLLYLAFALVGLACTLVLLLLVWLDMHGLAVFLGRGPKVQATPVQQALLLGVCLDALLLCCSALPCCASCLVFFIAFLCFAVGTESEEENRKRSKGSLGRGLL